MHGQIWLAIGVIMSAADFLHEPRGQRTVHHVSQTQHNTRTIR